MEPIRTKRRRFLSLLAGIPGLHMIVGDREASAVEAVQSSALPGRDVVQELGVRSFINAAGTFTMMTGSLMRPGVMEAMQLASKKYVMLDELHAAAGKRIAELVHAPSALVTAGCASAMCLGTAACITGSDKQKMSQIPEMKGLKNEVLVQKTHRVGYDHAIRNTGATMIEVETREELEKAINERTAMMFFLNFADPLGKIHHEEFVEIAKKHNIPTLIDAAADVPPAENLWRFTKMGFDLVAVSGGKGIRGPQSTGLLLGRKDLIAAAKLNTSPNGDTVGRTNKVNKEEIIGMLVALEGFLKEDHEAVWKDWEKRCQIIADVLKTYPDVKTEVFVPEIANAVPHLRIDWDEKARKLTPSQVVQKLREGTPSIEVGPNSSRRLSIGVWMMEPGEDAIVAQRLSAIFAGA